MTPNLLVIVLAALVPLFVGFIWYHPKVMGATWMKEAGVTEEQMKTGNMAKIFGLTFLLSIFLSLAMFFLTIHQTHLYSLLMNEPDHETLFAELMAKYGGNFRHFGHGAIHGSVGATLIALPVLGINALFERKSMKYIGIHYAYWLITIVLMGGIVCQWA